MNRVILATFFMLTVSLHLFAGQVDSLKPDTHKIVAYLEFYGHNYYGFQSSGETGILSLSAGYRARISRSGFYLFSSAGWGGFRERHLSQVPYQPINYYYDFINFFPIELTLQFGKSNHFIEAGFATVWASGKHWIYYSGSHGSNTVLEKDVGLEYVPRFGYVFTNQKGEFLRLSVTPHLPEKSVRRYDGWPLDHDRYSWIPFGISLGKYF